MTASRRSLLRHPVIHFLVGGSVLFVLNAWLNAPEPFDLATGKIEREPIVVTPAILEQLRTKYTRETGLVATADDEAALVEGMVEDEILYREAVARGFHRYDRSIRHRLIQKMRFVAPEGVPDEELYRQALELDLAREDLVIRRILVHKMRLIMKISSDTGEASDAELREYLEANADRYMQPARVSLTHVFLSAQKRGDTLEDDADQVLERLREEKPPLEEAWRAGDLFPLGHQIRQRSRAGLEKLFGSDFALAVLELEAGQWLGPVRSAYGLHLVWIDDVVRAEMPDLDSVRSQVTVARRTDERERRYREMLEGLRAEYPVVIERAAAAAVKRPS